MGPVTVDIDTRDPDVAMDELGSMFSATGRMDPPTPEFRLKVRGLVDDGVSAARLSFRGGAAGGIEALDSVVVGRLEAGRYGVSSARANVQTSDGLFLIPPHAASTYELQVANLR